MGCALSNDGVMNYVCLSFVPYNWNCAAHLNRQRYTKEVVKLSRKGWGEVVQFQSA